MNQMAPGVEKLAVSDDHKAAMIGPDGTLYQGVLGGIATFKDGS
jgi:hypothetical protein